MDDTKHENTTTNKPKLLDQVRNALRTKYYSIRTEESYDNWIKKFVLFHNKNLVRSWYVSVTSMIR